MVKIVLVGKDTARANAGLSHVYWPRVHRISRHTIAAAFAPIWAILHQIFKARSSRYEVVVHQLCAMSRAGHSLLRRRGKSGAPAGPGHCAPDARAVCLAGGGIDAGQSENALACNILGMGDYRVVIGNAVGTCTYVATLGNPGTGVPSAGQIGVARVAAANTVRVQTRNAVGAAANRSFHLVVAC